MMYVTGPLMSGKKEFARKYAECKGFDFDRQSVCEVQRLAASAPDLEALADELSRYAVVIATEVGGGVVPVDAAERAAREAAGRLACLLAERAETVVRMFCAIPTILKGELPC